MVSNNVEQVVADLIADPGVTVIIGGDIEDGDRVRITIEDVEATGTVGPRSLHWSTMKGVNTIPVVLDGTGQRIEVHASHVTKEAP